MISRDSSMSASGSSRPRKRRANIYDAVQGRVTQAGLVEHVRASKSSNKPLRPDEVLFKRKNAPIRYQETDYYPAHTQLPADQQLPSGELSSAVHAYVSNLYARTEGPGMQKAWRCIDETALVAMSILMEETARSVLGETGDLAFTEPAEEDEEQLLARKNQWTLAGEGTETDGRGKERGRASKKERSKKEATGKVRDAWVSSDEGSQYASDEME